MNILDAYVLKEPHNQNILDIFKGEWTSKLPERFGLVTQPGTAGLFEDNRVVWAEQTLGSFSGLKILELGPLEGGHSYMFQNRNARKVISIEANTRAFLKCLCIKEVCQLDRVEFKLGDFMIHLEKDESKYDMVLASGVLYHMEEPIKLLREIARVSGKVYLWTHYYDKEVILGREDLRAKFSPVGSLEYEGVAYEYSSQSYGAALEYSGFCGGPRRTSKWLTRESILNALNNFGFTNIQINFEEPQHLNGPAFIICARKEND